MKTWHFEAMDTWYFRESRGHDSVGVSELASVFPPPASTLAGAIRTTMGENLQVDWQQWGQSRGSCNPVLQAQIGFGEDMGAMQMTGPFLMKSGQRLYPWPVHLLERVGTADAPHQFSRLRLGTPLHTHLGRVHAPDLPKGQVGFKVPENVWLTETGFCRVLDGGVPDSVDILRKEDLYAEESRLGIALKAGLKTVEESLLYQTRHIRPNAELGLEMIVEGLDAATPASGMVRLGGEGRSTRFSTQTSEGILFPVRTFNPDDHGLLLISLTPVSWDRWVPSHFQPDVRKGLTTWVGDLAGVSLRIHGAAIGKVQREGGWDMATNTPKPVGALLPAGSVWYCTPENVSLAEAAAALHGQKLGQCTVLGRGLLAVGRWPNNEFNA